MVASNYGEIVAIICGNCEDEAAKNIVCYYTINAI